jgi:hypothetical protein
MGLLHHTSCFIPNLISFILRRHINQPVVSPFMRNLRVYTCTEGLIRLRNRKPNIIRWDQIKRVRYFHRNSLYKSTVPIVIVYRNDGKMFSFSSIFPNIDELGTTIEHEFALHRDQYASQ